jgi:alkanesulfonate monooxygenase SsuD/methylene tetrahydromethanopterin reductase-like flavin-dependent oxidoreductase (luciferase family)
MRYDIFFSISQTPVGDTQPSERTMFAHFFDQVEAADRLGYGTAWVAESHLSSEVQKRHRRPVIPHWRGEVGLNTDILQLATAVFRRTKRIEVGSAVMNLLTNGGPIAHAERIATFLTLHGLALEERRRIHIGFATGRFDFMAAAFGLVPRDTLERNHWPVVKGKVLLEASEIFVRLLDGQTLSSDDIPSQQLTRADFRSDADWERARADGGVTGDTIPLRKRYEFEPVKIVPQEFRRELLQLIIGSHDPNTQEYLNRFAPVQVFNLSITRPEVIEDTHRRLARAYHPAGGAWQRANMPRTVFVFLHEDPELSPEENRAHAEAEARDALAAYWTALEGTLDKSKVENAADNALVGDAASVAQQIVERFHPDDRLMLWFDFFNHDNARVIQSMTAFQEAVAPRVEALLRARANGQRLP